MKILIFLYPLPLHSTAQLVGPRHAPGIAMPFGMEKLLDGEKV